MSRRRNLETFAAFREAEPANTGSSGFTFTFSRLTPYLDISTR